MDLLIACASCRPCGPYGLLGAALGLGIGMALRASARLVVLLVLLLVPSILFGGQPELRIIVPGVPGSRAIVGSAPVYLRAWARFEDPRREYVCPTWEWRWDATGDGETSTAEETSCDPFALDDQQPTSYRSPDARHVYRTPGTARLDLIVRAQGRTLRASRDVIVIGPSSEDYR